VIAAAAAGERGQRRLGDLGVRHPPLLVVIPEGVGVADRGPRVVGNGGDGLDHGGGEASGDREPGPRTPAGGDDVVAVVGRVRPHQHRRGRAAANDGGQGIGEQPGGAAGGVGRSFPQPCRGDQRRRAGGGDDGEQRVQPFHPGVAAPSALLGVPVGLAHGVVDVDDHELVGAGPYRHRAGQCGQQPGGDRVELADMAEGEQPQEAAQRRRARMPMNSRGMPPWRSRSTSSIESAPHTIPATIARIFAAAFTPPFAAIFTCSRSSAGGPQRSANAMTGTRPAHDTRFGSSNRTLTARRAWIVASSGCPSVWMMWSLDKSHRPNSEGIRELWHAPTSTLRW
jgi:hypothetical protein